MLTKRPKLGEILPILLFVIFFIMPILGKNGVFLVLIVLAVFFIINKFKNQNITNLNSDSFKDAIDLGKINSMNNIKKISTSVVVAILGLWLFFSSIVIVDAGETGVYSLFGKVKDSELKSGFHLVIPLAHVTRMSTRTEEYTMSKMGSEGKKTGDDSISALTKEGLEVSLDITVFYHLDEAQASDVYKNVGKTFEEKIVRPEIRSTIREVVSQFDAKEMYADKREEANGLILSQLKAKLDKRGIIVEDTLMRNVSLPANLAQSIQEKLQAEQEAQKYEFILQKEMKEKERKIIEAEGQRDAQKIISEGLSTNYLYYVYINQLKDRQGTIYVPTGATTGMPLFSNIGK